VPLSNRVVQGEASLVGKASLPANPTLVGGGPIDSGPSTEKTSKFSLIKGEDGVEKDQPRSVLSSVRGGGGGDRRKERTNHLFGG